MRRQILSIIFTILYFGATGVYFLWIIGWFNSPMLQNGKNWKSAFEQKLIALKPSTEIRPPVQTATPKPTLVPIGKPIQIVIDKIGIDTEVVEVGLVSGTNVMDVPKDGFKAGWYNQRPLPGEEGSSIITAHYDTSTGAPALFYNLKKLAAKDEFYIVDENGHRIDYVIREVKSLPVATFPKDLIYRDKGYSQLSLITCSGIWNPVAREYSNRLVVIATLKNVSSFGNLVALNRENEIQIMQPAENKVKVGIGKDGLYSSFDNNSSLGIYIETNNSEAVAADVYLKVTKDFSPHMIEVTNIFQSYTINYLQDNIMHLQLFQPQDYNLVGTEGMQVMVAKINMSSGLDAVNSLGLLGISKIYYR